MNLGAVAAARHALAALGAGPAGGPGAAEVRVGDLGTRGRLAAAVRVVAVARAQLDNVGSSVNELDEVSAGQQVVLSTTVNNNRNTDLAYAAVIEVRDADGFTVLLQWATGTLPAGGENEVGLSWTPMDAGEYTIRTFVLSDISNPSALSLIEESTLTVS